MLTLGLYNWVFQTLHLLHGNVVIIAYFVTIRGTGSVTLAYCV